MIKKTMMFIIAALILLSVAAVIHADGEIAAKINGKAITKAEFDRNWQSFSRQRRPPASHDGFSGNTDDPRMELLDILIDQELLWQEAKKKDYTVSEDEISAEIRKFKSRYPNEDSFVKAMQQNGMTMELFQDFIGQKLSVQKLINEEVGTDVTVSKDDVHQYYISNPDTFKNPEQVSARHILIKVDQSADQATRDAARKKVEGLQKKIMDGADFAEMAKANSECPSANKGGDLGYFTRGRMVKPFEEASFSLKTGEVSDIVETQFGYHIIKVEDHKEASLIPEETVASKIESYLKSQKVNEAVQEHVKLLRKEAKIEILLDK